MELLDRELSRVNVYYEPYEGAKVVGPLDGALDITRCATAADVRAKIVAEGLGAHASLSRPVAELSFCFLAYDQGEFSVVTRTQESDPKRPVLGPMFALKPKTEGGNWRLVLRGSDVLSRAGALDPAQRDVLLGEVDHLRGGGGDAKGADVVGEIADILEDLHEQRNEQGEQKSALRVLHVGVEVCVASCATHRGHEALCP